MNLKGITVQGIEELEMTYALLHGFCQKVFGKVFLRNVASVKLLFSKKRIFCMGTHIQVATVKSELHTKRNICFVCRCSLLSLKI